jgi:hypothetical protein
MTLERLRADLAAAEAADQHHQAKLLRWVLDQAASLAARNQRDQPSETDVQTVLRAALAKAEAQEDRMELANRLAAAEISERDVLLLAGYVDDQE